MQDIPQSSPPRYREDGLFRTRLAGCDARLSEAFSVLRNLATANRSCHASSKELYGQRLAVSEQEAEGSWELISLRDEIYMIVSDCHYAERRSEIVVPEGFVEFHFNLSGPVTVEFSGAGNVEILIPNLTVVFQGDDICYSVSCGPGKVRSVSFYISREYFWNFIEAALGTSNAINPVLNAVGNTEVLCHQMPLCPGAVLAVEQLFQNPYQGHRRLLYAEAKAIEILCASVDIWKVFLGNQGPAEAFSARDIRLIEKAKNLMLEDISRVPTILELARKVGTNTSKLKRGFKFLYGTTIFDFGHAYRMRQALNLLVSDRISVNEVASAVGYQHQTSFTASFRQYFGFSPKDARRMTSSNLNGERATEKGSVALIANNDNGVC